MLFPVFGLDWVWMGFAVLADLGGYAASAARRRDVSWYRRSLPELDRNPGIRSVLDFEGVNFECDIYVNVMGLTSDSNKPVERLRLKFHVQNISTKPKSCVMPIF